MASYPTAVKTFVSRNAGDVIQPAHVNDLQDEVNALEAGLLNGTAPLNSSNSTVATLSVAGTLTLRGKPYATPSSAAQTNEFLQCVSTSGSTAVLEWRSFPSQVAVTRCALRQASTQNIAAADTWTALNWDVEDINVGPMHSTSANSSRITFATSTGEFLFQAAASFMTQTGNYLGLRFLKNSTTQVGQAMFAPTMNFSGAQTNVFASALHRITSTADYVCVQVIVSGSTSQTPTSTSVLLQNSVTVIQVA